MGYVPSSGKVPNLVCLGADNRWYIVTHNDVTELCNQSLPATAVESLVPSAEPQAIGEWRKGNDATAAIGEQLTRCTPLQSAPEVLEQQQRVDKVLTQLEQHPLQQQKIPVNCLSAISNA